MDSVFRSKYTKQWFVKTILIIDLNNDSSGKYIEEQEIDDDYLLISI